MTFPLLLGVVAISAWWLGAHCGAGYREGAGEGKADRVTVATCPSVDAGGPDDAAYPDVAPVGAGAAAIDAGRPDARAVDPRCAMTEVIGTGAGTGVAPELSYLRDKLAAPPLSSWSSFVRGATNRRGEPLHMVDGTEVRARILSVTDGRVRIELTAVNRGESRLSARVEMEPGAPWIIAVGANSDAVLIAVVECMP